MKRRAYSLGSLDDLLETSFKSLLNLNGGFQEVISSLLVRTGSSMHLTLSTFFASQPPGWPAANWLRRAPEAERLMLL